MVAGGALTMTAGGDGSVQGSSLTAGGDLSFESNGDLVVESTQDTLDVFIESKSKGGLFGGSSSLKYERNDVTNTSSVLKSGGKLTLDSEQGNVAVVASKLEATGDIRLDADQGAVAIKARKDSRYERLEINNANLMSFKTQDTGRIDETVIHTTMKTDGSIIIETSQGVIADYKISGTFEESTAQLAALPGLEYIDQLKARTDVNWQGLSEAHQQWDYKAQGLGPGAAVLIAIAVGVATGGAGLGAGANLAGITTEGLTATMANAAFNSIVSQAITSGFNNHGDIGAILKDLASSAAIKSLATSMLTAGLTQGVSAQLAEAGVDLGSTVDGLGIASPATNQMLKVALDQAQTAAVSTIVQTAIQATVNGQDVGTAFNQSLRTSAISALGATVSNIVGTNAVNLGFENGGVVKTLAHGIAQGMVAKLAGGQFSEGALAGAASEVLSESIATMGNSPQQRADISALVSATAVLLAGGDAQAVSLAASTGRNIELFNRNLHPKEKVFNYEIAVQLAVTNGTSAAEELPIVKFIACQIVQCNAGPGSPPIDPASPEYQANLERLYGLYPDHMAFVVGVRETAIQNGVYAPYLYTNGGLASGSDYIRDVASSLPSGQAAYVDLEMAAGGVGAIKGAITAVKVGVPAVINIVKTQMASVAAKIAASKATTKLPSNASQLKHIFADRSGHIIDTPQNRQLVLDTAKNQKNYMGPGVNEKEVYGSILPDGTQVWVEVRKGIIQNTGINIKPRTYIPGIGFKRIQP